MPKDPVELIAQIRAKLAAVATVQPVSRLGSQTTVELKCIDRMVDAMVKRFHLAAQLEALEASERSDSAS